ncbi:MAG: efflux RND transporter periplasmic adaptor subunit [Nitrospiria bacterium]
MKSKKMIIALSIALMGIVAAAWLFWPTGSPDVSIVKAEREDDHDHAEEDGHDEEHEEHEDDGDQADHDDHDEEKVIRLSDGDMKEFGIKLGRAGPGSLHKYVNLPGEVRTNSERLVHVVPRVSGIVREVRKSLGDRVKKGEVIAVVDSRDLADTKAAFLAAIERVTLAEANFLREEVLRKKKISSEQDYLEAKQVLAEARIERRSAEQKLHALGFSERYLEELPNQPDESFTRYEIVAPFKGTVIEKHITLGEALKDDAKAFVIVDLSTVWVDLSVYQKDLPFIRKDQPVVISGNDGVLSATGKIAYLGPVIGEETRTTLARIVLPNEDGKWRPGLFINAKIAVDQIESDLIVPKQALQSIENKPTLFIATDEGLKPQEVTVGRRDGAHVEIMSGIQEGQRYVMEGAFTLRAQLGKGDLGDGHTH